MSWDVIFFYAIAAVCILSALGMVAVNNPVHSAVFLVICFFNVAAVFVMLGAEFLAATQVIVYTGAILVLVVFVLMLVDPDDLPEFHTARPIQRYVGLLLGAILLLEVGIAILDRTVVGRSGTATPDAVTAVGGNTQALGRTLYSGYLFPFEIVSLVLTVGVIGAIVLALPERLGARIRQRQGTISLGHPRGTDFALPAGPAGETPIEVEERPRVATAPGAPRELVMAREPDQYTRVGKR
jgi:NADH-quinone oxidoreductase subunit J